MAGVQPLISCVPAPGFFPKMLASVKQSVSFTERRGRLVQSNVAGLRVQALRHNKPGSNAR